MFPAILPFERTLVSTQRYLQQLGLKRWEVMQAFAGNEADIDLEYLGISGRIRDILTGSAATETTFSR